MTLPTIYLKIHRRISLLRLSLDTKKIELQKLIIIQTCFSKKAKLAKLKDNIVSEIKTEIKNVINVKFNKIELTRHQEMKVIRNIH